MSGRRDFNIGKKARAIIFIGEIAAAVLLLALIYFFGKEESGINKSLFGEIYGVLHGRVDLTTGNYRLGVWKYALDIPKHSNPNQPKRVVFRRLSAHCRT